MRGTIACVGSPCAKLMVTVTKVAMRHKTSETPPDASDRIAPQIGRRIGGSVTPSISASREISSSSHQPQFYFGRSVVRTRFGGGRVGRKWPRVFVPSRCSRPERAPIHVPSASRFEPKFAVASTSRRSPCGQTMRHG